MDKIAYILGIIIAYLTTVIWLWLSRLIFIIPCARIVTLWGWKWYVGAVLGYVLSVVVEAAVMTFKRYLSAKRTTPKER